MPRLCTLGANVQEYQVQEIKINSNLNEKGDIAPRKL